MSLSMRDVLENAVREEIGEFDAEGNLKATAEQILMVRQKFGLHIPILTQSEQNLLTKGIRQK